MTEKEIEERIEKKLERKSFDELNKIQKLESRIDKLEDRVNLEDLEELDLEMTSRSSSENSSSGSKSQQSSSSKDSKEILTPADVSKSMKGETVKIKGELEYRKEASDNKFYRLSGGGSNVIVRSDHSIPEGRRILNGEVELIKGNICFYVDQ